MTTPEPPDEPDDFRSWCKFYEVDPQGPHAHGLYQEYQDWVDANDRTEQHHDPDAPAVDDERYDRLRRRYRRQLIISEWFVAHIPPYRWWTNWRGSRN